MRRLGKTWWTTVLSLASLTISTVVAAEPITVLFTGRVTFMNSLLSGAFDMTQELSGSYTFESTTSDSFPANTTTSFYSASDFSATLGGFTATSAAAEAAGFVNPVGIRLRDNEPIQVFSGGVCCAIVPLDQYSVEATFNGSIGGVSGFPLTSFQIRLTDFVNLNGITSDALPTDPPDLSVFIPINRYWEFVFAGGPTGVVMIGGEITSLARSSPVSAVPEPGTLVLLSSALLGLCARRTVSGFARRWRESPRGADPDRRRAVDQRHELVGAAAVDRRHAW
jgi:hypothetical protein